MKKRNKILTIMLASTMFFAACDNQETNNAGNDNTAQTETTSKDSKSKEKLDKNTVALVNGKEISRDDYKKEIDFYSSYIASQQNLKNSIIDIMVQDKLVMEELEKNNIEITDKEVTDAFMERVSAAGGQEQFDKMLDDYNFDVDSYKQNVKTNLMYIKHKEWFDEAHPVTDEEVNKYFEENKEQFTKVDASHILLEDEATAKEVKEKLDNGEKWDDLAAEYSKDPGNAENGGHLGEFSQGDMVPEFNDKVFSMEAGEISDPVETQFGFHIIKLNKVIDSIDGSKDQIKAILAEEKYAEYFKELTENSDIVTEMDQEKEDAETVIETEQTNDAADSKQEDESVKSDEKEDEESDN